MNDFDFIDVLSAHGKPLPAEQANVINLESEKCHQLLREGSLTRPAVTLAKKSDLKYFRKHPDRSYRLRPMIKGEAPVLGPPPDGTRYVTIVRNEPGTGQMRFLTTVPVNMDIKRASDQLLNVMWSFLMVEHEPDYVLNH